MINVLFAAEEKQWPLYQEPLVRAFAAKGIKAQLSTDIDPALVDYIVYAPNSAVQDFAPFTGLRAVLNLWAGVEGVVHNQTLKVPLARMVDEAGLTQGMVEWVSAHVLRHHLNIDLDIKRDDRRWQVHHAPLSSERPVTILGMGALGQACAKALIALGFPVTGWARRPKPSSELPEGMQYFHGPDGLQAALRAAQVLVLLLPATAQTKNIINAKSLAQLPQGAFLLNPGRGDLIDDESLIAACDNGQIAHATLDTFKVEPLPPDHSFWAHPSITVTPHIASITRPQTAAEVIAENISRDQKGQGLLHLVDRAACY